MAKDDEPDVTVKAPRRAWVSAAIIAAVGALIVGANAWMLWPLKDAQAEAAALIEANESAGTEVAQLEAERDELIMDRELVEAQIAAAELRLVELASWEDTNVAAAADVRAGVDRLIKCYDARKDLIDYLWTTGSQLIGTDRVADVKDQCDAAHAAFKKVKVDTDE